MKETIPFTATGRGLDHAPDEFLCAAGWRRPRVAAGAFLGLAATLILGTAATARAQVNPAEILDPKLKAAEQTYLPQLITLSRAIQSTKFPFSFFLSRYVGLDPARQREADTRGIEFVKFHEETVLKVTGNYNAAYNPDLLTQNQRAARTFQDVLVPILQLVTQDVPSNVSCDAVGFEISYHVRRRARNYDYEGKEILVVVFDKADAYNYLAAPRDSARQDILNRSQVYVDGKDFGLALGERDPFPAEGLERADRQPDARPASPVVAAVAPTAPAPHAADTRLASAYQSPLPSLPDPDKQKAESAGLAPSGSADASPHAAPPSASPSPGGATQADADRLQTQYQAQLDALGKEGAAKFHFVDYAPPSFVVFRNQVYLQLTLRNPARFDPQATSIYRRAAQSFDLFLAPQLKPLVDKLPADADFAGLDVTVLNQLAAQSTGSSEAVEFVCPLKPLRQFVNAEITNQELINQSAVLVNGVRIALNLQQVE